ncbi:cytoplasmic dynein 1 light intermediate chain 2-like [Anopheles ziemanni]|uniref:cytoplasmic dynein 1 light intermediate chain 2-like n=1 Tax=Anopheles coustani TaxID=139045 RepID=UPI002657AB5D|nr:cytoplasmic dynein 1 light intermediate chain 2-like [Anopheles coustani]XP_058177044.1 cytoplasmic dynein 1 light intermediate chain 2-like [Anopheles ziemanni]
MVPNKKPKEAKENLWSSILTEVQTQNNVKLPSNKSVLVLGDIASGKTTLITKLRAVGSSKNGSGLEYAYIDVRDEHRDEQTRLNVWILDGDPAHTNLLKFALNENSYPHTLVLVTLSMTTPWNWKDQLEHWMKILENHIAGLSIDPEKSERCQARLTTRWQKYFEDFEAESPTKSTDGLSSQESKPDALPLSEGVLTVNLGLDIVVVVTKTDFMKTLEKDLLYRGEHFDFMEQMIRRFCLMYGAALFYTSVPADKNCDLLYSYLTHRIYGLPFQTSAQVMERDAVLIPAGWDSMQKVAILYESMPSCQPGDSYNDVIVEPPSRKIVSNTKIEIETEDEYVVLARLQQMLLEDEKSYQTSDQLTPLTAATSQDSENNIDAQSIQETRRSSSVLEDFFNLLRNNKPAKQ